MSYSHCKIHDRDATNGCELCAELEALGLVEVHRYLPPSFVRHEGQPIAIIVYGKDRPEAVRVLVGATEYVALPVDALNRPLPPRRA